MPWRTPEFREQLRARVRAVTPAEVNRAIRTYFAPASFTRIELLPRGRVRDRAP